jgi:orotate phosphoribosyltransferase
MRILSSEEVLQIFRQSKALLTGHFELRSGLHSGEYFQCALVLQYPRVAERLCRGLFDLIKQTAPKEFRADAVISPALGGIIVGQEVGRAMNVKTVFAEKEDGKLVLRRGFEILKGEHYLVAEDVMTRGGRIQETIDIVTSRGAVVDGIAVLVDRSGGKNPFRSPIFSLVRMEPVAWDPSVCPLCKQGIALDHPGS